MNYLSSELHALAFHGPCVKDLRYCVCNNEKAEFLLFYMSNFMLAHLEEAGQIGIGGNLVEVG